MLITLALDECEMTSLRFDVSFFSIKNNEPNTIVFSQVDALFQPLMEHLQKNVYALSVSPATRVPDSHRQDCV